MEEHIYLRSSYETWKGFMEGSVWQDLDAELKVWEDRILSELSNPTFDTNKGEMHFHKDERVLYDEYLRGCLKAVRDMRALPHMVLGNLEADAE